MIVPVDLTNLRSMTDGDIEMERALFEEFYIAFEFGLQALQSSCEPEKEEMWRSTAHALKGMALNLGASHLGELCRTAQDLPIVSSQHKQEFLTKMMDAYKIVKNFLMKLGQ